MNIIFTPTQLEADSLKQECNVTGMGKLAITHALYKHKNLLVDNTAVLVGFCGLLKGNFKIGDLIPSPSVYVDGDYNAYPVEESIHFIEIKKSPTIVCISQEKILTKNPYEDICATFKAAITDMESYAFVEFCRMHQIKYKVFRVVSDIVGEKSAEDFNQSCLNGVLREVLAKELI